eukprot:4837463-Prymnesium_polylepis.2
MGDRGVRADMWWRAQRGQAANGKQQSHTDSPPSGLGTLHSRLHMHKQAGTPAPQLAAPSPSAEQREQELATVPAQRGEELERIYGLIPAATNVLVSHAPPHGILDNSSFSGKARHLGSKTLLARVGTDSLPDLKLHVFGQVHVTFNAGDVPCDVLPGTGSELVHSDDRRLDIVHSALSLCKRCGSSGLTPVAGDVRVLTNGARPPLCKGGGSANRAGQGAASEGQGPRAAGPRARCVHRS